MGMLALFGYSSSCFPLLLSFSLQEIEGKEETAGMTYSCSKDIMRVWHSSSILSSRFFRLPEYK